MTRERQHLIALNRETSQAKGVAILLVGAVGTLVLFFALQNVFSLSPLVSILLSLLTMITYGVYSLRKFAKMQKNNEQILNTISEASVKQTFELYKKRSVGSFSLIFNGTEVISTSTGESISLMDIVTVSVKKQFTKSFRTLKIEYKNGQNKNFKVDRNPEVLEFVEGQMKLYNKELKATLS